MKRTPIALSSLAVAGLAHAGSFAFNSQNDPPDLLMGFRQLGSSSEMVANLGSIFIYTQATPGSSFLVTNVSPSEITRVFPSFDDLKIDIFGGVVTVDVIPGDPVFATLWLVRGRTNVNFQTSPWLRKSETVQANTANRIAGIGDGAASFGGGELPGQDNTSSWVVMPSDYSSGYSAYMGPIGNFSSTFAGNTELTLPVDFATGGVVARLDLYELDPLLLPKDPNKGTFLGYFDFGTDAALTFHAAGGLTNALPPLITGISRNNSGNTVSFQTVAGGYTYTLLRAPAAGLLAPVAQWTVVGSGIVGTGNPASLNDTTDNATAYYRVQVSP